VVPVRWLGFAFKISGIRHCLAEKEPHSAMGFRPALEKYGLWDMLRVDHGTEASLIRFVQTLLKDHRPPDVTVDPSVQPTTLPSNQRGVVATSKLPYSDAVKHFETGGRMTDDYSD